MTRKDFELIASVIRNMREYKEVRERTAADFAAALKRTNANFNIDRFLKACGVETNV